MKQLVCEMCGSTDLIKQDGVFVCQSCGCKYSVEEAKKMMVEGTVEVQGTVKVDNSEELTNLYQLARRAKAEENSDNAARYYDMILTKDSSSWEAAFYAAYYKALNCTIAQIESAATAMANSIPNVIMLLAHTAPAEQVEEPVTEIQQRACHLAQRMAAASFHAYEKDNNFRERDNDFRGRFFSAVKIASTAGDMIFDQWRDCPWAQRLAMSAYHTANDLMLEHPLLLPAPPEPLEVILKKRNIIYWLAHPEAKAAMDENLALAQAKLDETERQITAFDAELEAIRNAYRPRREALAAEKAALSILKVKERMALQGQIDALEKEQDQKVNEYRSAAGMVLMDGREFTKYTYLCRTKTALRGEIFDLNAEVLVKEYWDLDGDPQNVAENAMLKRVYARLKARSV